MLPRVLWLFSVLLAALAWPVCVFPAQAQLQAPNIRYQVVASYPHDTTSYTQGLLYLDGKLFESSGLYGRSDVHMSDLESGKVLARKAVPPQWFGEGLARIGQRLYQLTWQAGTGIIYRLPFLTRVAQFHYQGQGWGLAYDGQALVMSNGSATLKFIDPRSFAILRTIEVKDGDSPIDQLNELEYVDGALFANVWHESRIARIDPGSGRVTGWLQLGDLYTSGQFSNVMNGIAWDPLQRRLLVTGKRWPQVFALELLP